MTFSDPFRRVTRFEAGRSAVRRREMPIVASDERQHYANVATLTCQHVGCECGGQGASQVAHSNFLEDGKARSLKAPWWMVAALCPVAHVAIDSGNTMSRGERRAAWKAAHIRTNYELFARGLLRPT